jgi:hypothetical protein
LTATATANGQQTLIEHWDGSAWSEVPNPNPSDRDALIGVAALSAHDVWATGAWSPVNGSSTNTLTERYSDPCTTPPLISVISRKTHGSAGTFDVDLPLTGPRGIECRSGDANGDYTLVFTFPSTLTAVARASVTSGTGSVSNSAIGPNPNQYSVNLTGVTNAEYVTVTLTGVVDSAGNVSSTVAATMGVLLGDVNANGVVSNTDVASVKSQVAAPVTASNFRNDVNVNGIVSNTDVSATKAQVGTSLP